MVALRAPGHVHVPARSIASESNASRGCRPGHGARGPQGHATIPPFASGSSLPGLFEMAGQQQELSEVLGGTVDVKTVGFLSRYFGDEVLAETQEEYVA